MAKKSSRPPSRATVTKKIKDFINKKLKGKKSLKLTFQKLKTIDKFTISGTGHKQVVTVDPKSKLIHVKQYQGSNKYFDESFGFSLLKGVIDEMIGMYILDSLVESKEKKPKASSKPKKSSPKPKKTSKKFQAYDAVITWFYKDIGRKGLKTKKSRFRTNGKKFVAHATDDVYVMMTQGSKDSVEFTARAYFSNGKSEKMRLPLFEVKSFDKVKKVFSKWRRGAK